MSIALAFVHHANQYLITEGYENRHGLREAVGSVESKSGFAWILELHRRYDIPVNLHMSGTLVEAIAWHAPEFLRLVHELCGCGLVGMVGSCYAQNIMRFFSHEHNLKQLNEELRLYEIHLGIDPEQVKVFWPPERVWDTPRMAPVLNDSRLLNHGYKYILLDDRLLLNGHAYSSPRKIYDRQPRRDVALHHACPIADGHDLLALPISTHLRLKIPPCDGTQFQELQDHCRWLASLEGDPATGDFIAIYADDMEKAAGLGAWNRNAPGQFESVLRLIAENPSIRPVHIADWAANRTGGPGPIRPEAPPRPIDVGTFLELANHFAAGEGYEKWFFDPQWDRYREYFSWAERRVEQFSLSGADPALIDLAEKHLIASSWETAWHTPSEGPFGNPNCYGEPSPWIQALGSHCRHAVVIGEAAYWARHHDSQAHATLHDIDADGEDELILKNNKLFAVISPRWGGRLVALFSLQSPEGSMVIGNPSDDWNWMQELNRFMEVPPNHPGALSDVGLEHDGYEARIRCALGNEVSAELQNIEASSLACGMTKRLTLAYDSQRIEVSYTVPESLGGISVDFAFSPDYLNLLRHGCALLRPFEKHGARGWGANSIAVWVCPESPLDATQTDPFSWDRPYPENMGHKACLRVSTFKKEFSLSIGVTSI